MSFKRQLARGDQTHCVRNPPGPFHREHSGTELYSKKVHWTEIKPTTINRSSWGITRTAIIFYASTGVAHVRECVRVSDVHARHTAGRKPYKVTIVLV